MAASTPTTYQDWETLKERKRTADALRLKAQEGAPQGQMVSGHYVAPSWTQHLSHGLKNYMASRESRKVDQEMEDWRKGKDDTMRRVADILRGGTGMPETSMPEAGMGASGNYAPVYADPRASGAPDIPQPPMIPLPQDGEPASSALPPEGQTYPRAQPSGQPYGAGMSNSLDAIVPTLLSHPGTADMAMQILMQRAQSGDEMARTILLEQIKQQSKGPEIKSYQDGTEQVTARVYPDGRIEEMARGPKFNPNPAPGVSVSYGAPIVGIGPDGQTRYYQPSNRGGLSPTEVAPPPNAAGAAKPVPEFQGKASMFATRMEQAESRLAEAPMGEPTFVTKMAEAFGPTAERIALTPQQQVYKQAVDDWVRAKLRFESGAVIGEEEMAREYLTYFPQPGDTPQVIAAKARARAVATQEMRSLSGQRPSAGGEGEVNLGDLP